MLFMTIFIDCNNNNNKNNNNILARSPLHQGALQWGPAILQLPKRTNLHLFSFRVRRLSKNHLLIDCRSIFNRDSRVAASFTEHK